ncbi:MAG: GGDEF domain-containing protein [Desulfovibrio sp.]|jgi:diguanylate cyclase (GGDEF)-like protein|nr:GGDEF domain-containing protein [Desulfovibrio sp.]
MNDIMRIVKEQNIFTGMFDAIRMVDARSGTVYELKDGMICQTGQKCVEALGSTERCRNCTSIRALYSNEQIVKLEYVGGSVILIISAPARVDGKDVVLEIIKDITTSMTVEANEQVRENEVSNIIDKFNRLATVDQLTGLMNRRYITEKLPNILESGRKLEKPVSLAMFDIDFFKKINDSYGHQAGDAVLAKIGGILNSFIRRSSDFAARYGGEEFMLCLPDTDLNNCREIAERIRKLIETTDISIGDNTLRVTISAGVACSSERPDMRQETFIEIADKRLYVAKSTGRNRVV